MTVSATTTRNDYIASSGQTVFAYTFKVLASTDLVVTKNGVVQSAYSVSDIGVATGGTVTFNSGVTANDAIALYLAMPVTRDTNYQEGGAFLAGEVNSDFDKIYIGAIQNENAIDRSMRLPESEPSISMTLPSKDARKGRYLQFNATTGAPEAGQTIIGDYSAGTGLDLANYVFSIDNTVATLTGTQTLSDKTLTSPILNQDLSGSAFLDEDNMASNSSTKVASQQSIKAYVDSQVGAATLSEVLANGNTTGGNDVKFGDNDKATFGASDDLEIFSDGTDSFIKETATGSLKIWAKDFEVYNAGGTETLINADANAGVQLYFNNAQKLATTSTGIDVTGNVSLPDNGKATFGAGDDLEIYHDGSNSIIKDSGTGTLKYTSSAAGAQPVVFEIENTDSQNSSGSFIHFKEPLSDAPVKVGGIANVFYVLQGDDNHRLIDAGAAGVKLYDGSDGQRLATNSSGIDVTGTATMDGLVVDNGSAFALSGTFGHTGGSQIFFLSDDGGARNQIDSQTNGSSAKLDLATGGTKRQRIDSNGDISFYEDTGTTAKLFWDASAESLGIGTSSPDVKLHLSDSTSGSIIRLERNDTAIVAGDIYGGIEFEGQDASTNASGVRGSITGVGAGGAGNMDLVFNTAKGGSTNNLQRLRISSIGDISFYEDTGTTPKMVWDASAESLGIGTTSPSAPLTLSGDTTQIRLENTASGGRNWALRTFGSALGIYDHTAGAFRQYIDSSGNVGIGTSAPSHPLTVSKAGAQIVGEFINPTASQTARIYVTCGTQTGQIQQYGNTHATDPNTMRLNTTAGDITLAPSSVERVRVTTAGNVGIGTSSPSSKLEVKSSGSNIDEISLVHSGNTVKVASLGQESSHGSLVLRSNTGVIQARLNAAGNANYLLGSNLGIGTSSPSSQYFNNLVVGNNAAGDKGITIRSNASNAGVLAFSDTDSADSGRYSGYIAYDHSNNAMRLHTNGGTERMRIDSSGNLLVGKTAADFGASAGAEIRPDGRIAAGRAGETLVLNRLTSDGAIALFRKNGTEVGSIGTSGGDLIVGTGNTGLLFFDATPQIIPRNTTGGNVDGDVDLGASGSRFKDLYLSNKVYANYIGSSGDTNTNIYFPASDQIRFITGAQEAARIDASQNLLVGTTSTLRNNKFHASSGNFVGGFNVTNGTGEAVAFFSNGTVVGTVSVTGSATTYNTSSDQRLKENIADADDAGSKIDAIQVRKYDWKADGSHQDYGMIAQELQAVAPEAVSGDADSEEMMGVDYSKLVPMLIKEIQSLRNRVAQLEE